MRLALNAGSATVKYRLTAGERTVAEGAAAAGDWGAAFAAVAAAGGAPKLVGHRVVHGGPLRAPTVVDDAVAARLAELAPLAPNHQPACLAGIAQARERWPRATHVAVFDTAFHATLPAAETTVPIDRRVAGRYGVRRYGFHGISHHYVAHSAARLLDRPLADLRLVVLHLGAGASACAVAGGRSLATSMGLTPTGGLVMATRSGDVDPGLAGYLHRAAGLPPERVEALLTAHSGLYGLTGESDMRRVLARRAAGDAEAAAAVDLYCWRVRGYIGAYAAQLGGLDAVVFTAGVGERAAAVRAGCLAGLEFLGVRVDPDRNAADAPTVSPPGAPVAVCVVPTDEQRAILDELEAFA